MRPTFLASWICEMPETTVQKMIGAITILISLIKPSPSALIQSLVAQAGSSQPNSAPSTIAISTWTYKTLYQGFAARWDARVAVTAVMTFTPCDEIRGRLSLPPTGHPARLTAKSIGPAESMALPGFSGIKSGPDGLASARRRYARPA